MITVTIKESTKSGKICKILKDRIDNGIYCAGDQLPSCRRLSEEFSVSYITANQALKQLVSLGIARNFRGRGIYIPSLEVTSESTRKVKIFGLAAEVPAMIKYMRETPKLLKENGWDVSISFYNDDIEDLRKELEEVDSFFVFHGVNNLQWHELVNLILTLGIQNRVVVLGELGNRYGISSIATDEPLQIRTAMDMLKKANCEKIALFSGSPDNGVEQQRIAVWRNYYTNSGDWKNYLFSTQCPSLDDNFEEFIEKYIRDMYNFGKFNDIDAIIFPDPLVAGIATGVFKDLGIKIPKEISVVSIGDANFLKFVRPQITVVDPNMEQHINAILEILEDKFTGDNELPLLYLCEPKIIDRDSIK